MKITHWTLLNGSGLANVANDMATVERTLGIEATVCDTTNKITWEPGMGADVHIVHSHLPDVIAFDSSKKVVCVEHGSPEHCFEISVQQGLHGGYGASDSLSVVAYLTKRADAVVTFWTRHADIWRSMVKAPVYCIPMGIDREFWKRQEGVIPLAGTPSLFTAENCHTAKWPLDLFFLWPQIAREFPDARLHALNIPFDQHRWWIPLSYMNGTHYTSYVYATKLDQLGLRRFFSASGFYLSPVRYGDFNRISHEAVSSSCKVISFRGNQYADYWLEETDHRLQAIQIAAIFKGDVPVRADKLEVPSTLDMGKAMVAIYEDILK